MDSTGSNSSLTKVGAALYFIRRPMLAAAFQAVCQRIAELHRNEPDQEVKDYCTGQIARAAKRANAAS